MQPRLPLTDILRTPMAIARTILTLILVAWLPISCCCRLSVLQDVVSDVRGTFEAHHTHACVPAGACGDRGPASDAACECPAHDQVYVRAAAPDLSGPAAVPVAVMPLPPVVTATGVPSRPFVADDDRAEARIRACSTLLRLHCALTI